MKMVGYQRERGYLNQKKKKNFKFPLMPAPFFKDFDKQGNDLLTKNYAKPNEWKIESQDESPQ